MGQEGVVSMFGGEMKPLRTSKSGRVEALSCKRTSFRALAAGLATSQRLMYERACHRDMLDDGNRYCRHWRKGKDMLCQ